MKLRRHHNLFLAIFCLLTACNPTKHLPEGESLYTGADVRLEGEGLTAKQKKVHRGDLQGLTRPRPNSRVLGVPIKLNFYNLFYKAKPNSFFGRLRNQLGEPPVVLSDVDLESNQKILQSHLENKGFFRARVSADTSVKNRKARAIYTADAGAQYLINSVEFVSDSGILTQTIRESAEASLLQVDQPFNLDVIKAERTRIDAYLKERGFYYFNPEMLLVRTDSTTGVNRVDMRVVVKPETPDNAREQYRINNVYIYSNYRLNAPADDTSKANAVLYEDYYVIDRRKLFKPKLFAQAMQFNPGDIYNRNDHNLTLSRLINLNEFRFVRNRFEPVPDSAKLNAYYYLTPMQRQSLRAEILATNKSNNLNGSQINLGWTHRNIFRAGEHLNITGYVGTEVQFGGNFKGYNVYRSGAEANLLIPRFFIPFFDIRTRGGYVPRTNVKLGYDLLNRRRLYTLNSYRLALGYTWRESLQKSHEFYPISINYVQPINVTQEYRDSINRYPYLENIIDSQFIIGTTYQYNYNDQASGQLKTNSFYFNGLIDLSGNLAGLIMGSNRQGGAGDKRILSARFDQYIKLEADGRYYRRFGRASTWANRVILGYGLPYGNSTRIPYVKQFFSGGNNSVRAFRSRSLLGAYTFRDSSGFLPDQTGDLKLEFNTEFRPHIGGPLYGAVFIDAGNAWLKNEDPTRPGAHFTKDFLKQLAIGGGVGIRLDIQIFVIRLDVAIPLRKPWEDNPWVLNQMRNGAWRTENIIYNLAIGYPF